MEQCCQTVSLLTETMLLRRYFSAAGVKVLHVFSITVEYYHYLTKLIRGKFSF